MVRTRFAPSPTGYLHIGGLRTALYAYLFARKQGGSFVLRIEDTDQNREVAGAQAMIQATMKETGLLYDEGPDVGGEYGPYVQSQRCTTGLYREYALQLVRQGDAYFCFCDKARLDALREKGEAQGGAKKYDKHCLGIPLEEALAREAAGQPCVIRQNIPTTGQTAFDDVLFGHIQVDNDTLDDNVLLKSDGMPTYNFANVVDDHLMGITHVLRGTEYLASTPKYNLLYQAFGWDIPVYIHVPPVMRDAQHKLSKRHGDASYEDFVAKGYLKEAVINYIALLGWSPGDNRELFTLQELEQAFSLEGLNKAPAIFDVDKLTWINAQYIRAMDAATYHAYAAPYYRQVFPQGRFDESILDRILQPRTEKFTDVPPQLDFLMQHFEYDVSLFVNKKMKTDLAMAQQALGWGREFLQAQGDWSEGSLHDGLMALVKEKGVKNGQLLYPLRVALCAKPVTPGGAIEAAALLGREESLRRIDVGIAKLEKAGA